MNKLTYFTVIFLLFGCNPKSSEYFGYPISVIDIKNIELQDSFWLPKVKTIQDTTIKYAFYKCSEEGRMDNFLIAGKVLPGNTHGKMPFDDTDIYKIIEGASYSLISQPNPALDIYLDSIIDIIKIGQEPDGYLTTWFTIDRKNPPTPWVQPSNERWENEISSHELYNSGHLFEAAAAHYWATGKRNLLNIALKNADLLVENFGPEKLHRPPGHQIVETGLIKLFHITHNPKYIELSKFFLDIRGDSLTHKLYGSYNQDHKPVVNQDEAVGHAVRAEYMYAGMTDIAAIYRDSAYYKAVLKIWDNIVNRKMYITGGVGSRHEGEAFGENYELPNLTAYNETCAAIASVYWNQRLFQLTGDAKYYDIVERTLYNGLISGISVDGKKFFYPNPLESDGNFPFNQGACTRSPWFDCSCCPTNLIRFIPSIPGLIYAQDHDNDFVNLYMSNKASLVIHKQKVTITQKTDYPWSGDVIFFLDTDVPQKFTLALRIPGWAQNIAAPGKLYSYLNKEEKEISLKINGKSRQFPIQHGYVKLEQVWKTGDKIELALPMMVHKVVANEKVSDDKDKIAFEYGPLVYCAEQIDNPGISELILSKNIDLQVTQKYIASNKLNVLIGNTKNNELTLIPYYLWSNRGVGKMKVWFPICN